MSSSQRLCTEAKSLSWEYPLTKKECCVRAKLAQEQRSEEVVARLSRAEAELEWLQYLTPGDVEGLLPIRDSEHDNDVLLDERRELNGCGAPPQVDGLASTCAVGRIGAGLEVSSEDARQVSELLEPLTATLEIGNPESVPAVVPEFVESPSEITSAISALALTPSGLQEMRVEGGNLISELVPHMAISGDENLKLGHTGGAVEPTPSHAHLNPGHSCRLIRGSLICACLVIGCASLAAFSPVDGWACGLY